MKLSKVSLKEFISALVVVGILCAVVMPVLTQADQQANGQDQAQSETCASNLKQVGLALIMYTQDFDEIYPSGRDWHGHGTGWAMQVWPYIKSAQVFHCPSDSNKNDVMSYGYNNNFVHLTANPPAPSVGQKLADLDGPSSTVMTFEVVNNGGTLPDAYQFSDTDISTSDVHRTGDKYAPWDGYSPAGHGTGKSDDLFGMGRKNADKPLGYATGVMQGSLASSVAFSQGGPRHMGRTNMGFADGHVKAMLASELSAGYNNDNPSNCGTATRAAGTSCAQNEGIGTFSIH